MAAPNVPQWVRAARWGAAALVAAAAVLVVLVRTAYRRVEAVIAGRLAHVVTAGHTLINRHTATFFLNVGTPKVFGVVVTPECSSAVVTALVLGVTALALATTRFTLRRALLAAAAGAGGFAALNMVRLVMIAFASDKWGLGSGYRWSHIWVGTFITVFGGVAAAGLYLAILAGYPGRWGQRQGRQ
jgi:exosortase/archaeosortase family protein